MDKVKEHFDSEAREFDELIIKLIPYYSQMLEALVDAVYFRPDQPIRILDLGCGTGTIAKKLADKYPLSTIVCLDIAGNMIEMSKLKLAAHANSEFIVGDFSKVELTGEYDVIVSSLALHHLENNEDKKSFYRKIYGLLKRNGVFYNADVVLASTDHNQKVFMQRWVQYMNKSVSINEITNKWMPAYETEDHPAILADQLDWLKEIGYKSIDVIWKYYNFSVYGGIK